MRFLAVALFFFGVAASYAQAPQVPHKMRFADMTLTIRDDARREIQKDVDALTQHPRYFGIKVERAKTYFPIIEKAFAEENLPEDFKYLVLQESALISDAVSVSNAVGFWQFKDFTAMEMGLRVDKEIDERMNIYSASRGAARYLKKNNKMFDNWLLALQSYQMGGGGVQRSVGAKYNGQRNMEITSETYWYVKKFLAHKVAFEGAVKGEPQLNVIAYECGTKKTLQELAAEIAVEEASLRKYNKWARNGTIPGDRTYTVIIPNGKLDENFNTLVLASSKASRAQPLDTKKQIALEKKKINGIEAIRAVPGETATTLAARAGVSISLFLKYNEISIDHEVEAGSFYFMAKRRAKASDTHYTARVGDNLWSVSQKFGVQLKRLKKYNKELSERNLKYGEVVWLTGNRPEVKAVPEQKQEPQEVIEVQDDTFFNWGIKPKESPVTKTQEPTLPQQQVVLPDKQILQEALPQVASTDSTHLVVKGETLYSLAKQYQISVTQLLEWNSLDITQGIKPGQTLKVRNAQKTEVPQPANTRFITHEVKPSDTLYSVARQYNVTIKELMDWNEKEDFALALGEKLKILSK